MTEYRLLKPLLVESLFVTVEPPHMREYNNPLGSISIMAEGMASSIEVVFDLEDALAAGIIEEVSSETRLDIEDVLKELKE
jgi:hypothetical protein